MTTSLSALLTTWAPGSVLRGTFLHLPSQVPCKSTADLQNMSQGPADFHQEVHWRRWWRGSRTLVMLIFPFICLFFSLNIWHFYPTMVYLFIFLILAVPGLCCSARAFSSCSKWGYSLGVARGLNCSSACGILVPQPGTKPASPALEGRFLTTGPPREDSLHMLLNQVSFANFHSWCIFKY